MSVLCCPYNKGWCQLCWLRVRIIHSVTCALAFQPFTYDGTSSLLVELSMDNDGTTSLDKTRLNLKVGCLVAPISMAAKHMDT